jgi:hypothetical protein
MPCCGVSALPLMTAVTIGGTAFCVIMSGPMLAGFGVRELVMKMLRPSMRPSSTPPMAAFLANARDPPVVVLFVIANQQGNKRNRIVSIYLIIDSCHSTRTIQSCTPNPPNKKVLAGLCTMVPSKTRIEYLHNTTQFYTNCTRQPEGKHAVCMYVCMLRVLCMYVRSVCYVMYEYVCYVMYECMYVCNYFPN